MPWGCVAGRAKLQATEKVTPVFTLLPVNSLETCSEVDQRLVSVLNDDYVMETRFPASDPSDHMETML